MREVLGAEDEEGEDYGEQDLNDDPDEGESNIESLNGGAGEEELEANNDGEQGYIGEFSSDYINAEIFKLFDVDGSGKITAEDLSHVAKAMGWS